MDAQAKQEAIFDKLCELQVLEHDTSLAVALRSAIAQLCGSVAFIEARAGKATATDVVRELHHSLIRDALGPQDPIPERFKR